MRNRVSRSGRWNRAVAVASLGSCFAVAGGSCSSETTRDASSVDSQQADVSRDIGLVSAAPDGLQDSPRGISLDTPAAVGVTDGSGTIDPGYERGPCFPNGTCMSGLACLSGLCVNPGSGGAGGQSDASGGAGGNAGGGIDAPAAGSGGSGVGVDAPLAGVGGSGGGVDVQASGGTGASGGISSVGGSGGAGGTSGSSDDDSLLPAGATSSADDRPIDPGGPGACAGPATPLLLSIPWISQVPPGQWKNTGNCGPTSYLMIDSYFQSTTPTPHDIELIDDWMAANLPGWDKAGYNGSGSSESQLAKLAIGYGTYPASLAFKNATCDDLVAELKAGRPVIVHVESQSINNDYPSTTMKSTGYGHYMVVGGMDSQYVYVFDPGRSASTNGCGAECKGRRFTLDSFFALWSKHARAGTYVRKTAIGCTCGDGICESQAPCNETCNSCEIDCGCNACQNCSASGT